MLDDDFVVTPDEDEKSDREVSEEIQTPKVYDKEWSDYVLSLLGDNDKFGDNPTRDGLRRIAEYLIGPIIRKSTHIIQAPKDKHGIATVSVTIVFHVNDGISLFNCREINSISEDASADCGEYNVESPFSLHQTATAETRAEARALRKILRLHKVVAAEEIVDKSVIEKNKAETVHNENLEIDELITEEQANLLDIMCQRCNVSVIDLINIGKTKYDNIEKVPSSVSFKLIKYLNEIQQKIREKHATLGDYDASWRTSTI
jgi:hypothetical protein